MDTTYQLAGTILPYSNQKVIHQIQSSGSKKIFWKVLVGVLVNSTTPINDPNVLFAVQQGMDHSFFILFLIP
jgi:hypothetical protein